MSRPNIIADVHDRELLADILDSPGWNVFVQRIVRVLARQRMMDSLAAVQRGNLPAAQAALSASQAVIESVLGAYEGGGVEPPEDIRTLRDQADLIRETDSHG